MAASGYEQTGTPLPPPKPVAPGPFRIHNREDLKKAIAVVEKTPGGGKGRELVRRYIIQRAKDLGLTADLPANWNTSGTVS